MKLQIRNNITGKLEIVDHEEGKKATNVIRKDNVIAKNTDLGLPKKKVIKSTKNKQ